MLRNLVTYGIVEDLSCELFRHIFRPMSEDISIRSIFHLGASPDGLIDDGKEIVEVKCLHKIGELSLREAADKKIDICVRLVGEDLVLKANHNFWYQIQGQLNITEREYCDLIIYSLGGLEVCILILIIASFL